MRKTLCISLAALAMLASSFSANAFDLKDLLKGNGGMIGNLIEGVFMKSDLDVKDLMGEWTSSGSAVNFADENLLMKAGGIAAASAIETKIDPYFRQYGLVGSTLTVNPDSTFTLRAKKLKLNGTVTKGANGDFIFRMKAFGKLKLGDVPAHVQKTSTSMNVMFDSSKIKNVLNLASKLLNMKSVKTVTDIVDKYDGIYVGCKLTKTGETENTESTATTTDKKTGLLESILGGKSQSTQKSDSTKNNSNTSTKSGSSDKDKKKTGGDMLKDILRGIGKGK